MTLKPKPKSDFSEVTKKVKFEIFPYQLNVVITNDVHKSRAKLDIMLGKSALDAAEALHVTNQYGTSYIFLDHKASPGVVAHEANHCVWAMMSFIGAKHEEEVMSYLLYYIIEEITKVMKKF